MTNALYTAAELRIIERKYQQRQGEFYLMQKAAEAIHAHICQHFPLPQTLPLLMLAGPGNNGGDALAAACMLLQSGYQIELVYCTSTPDHDCAYRGTAKIAWENLLASLNASIHLRHLSELSASFTDDNYCLIVDGLFGLGLQRPISGKLADLVQACNQLASNKQIPVLALDVASGIDSDSGAIVKSANAEAVIALRATTTMSFLADKPGLHTADALDYTGDLHIARLGITESDLAPARHFLLDATYPFTRPATRKRNSHKGEFGDVVVLGGASGMQGALILAARAAKLAGSGRIFAGFLEQAPAFDPLYPEIMCRLAANLDVRDKVVVIGPGLGQSPAAQQLCQRVFAQAQTVVVDADALNCLATSTGLKEIWQDQRQQARLLTPHPLEAARLLGLSTAEVQAQRFQALSQLCHGYQASVILKGAGSLIAAPDSAYFINRSGNPLLASGGSGDILSGLCGALLAQGLSPLDAAKLACFAHGAAADQLALHHPAWLACSSSELLLACRETLAQLLV